MTNHRGDLPADHAFGGFRHRRKGGALSPTELTARPSGTVYQEESGHGLMSRDTSKGDRPQSGWSLDSGSALARDRPERAQREAEGADPCPAHAVSAEGRERKERRAFNVGCGVWNAEWQ